MSSLLFNVNQRVHEVAQGQVSRRAINCELIADARCVCVYTHIHEERKRGRKRDRERERSRRNANDCHRLHAKWPPPRRGMGAHLRRDGRGAEDVAKIKAKQDKVHGEWRDEPAVRRRAGYFFAVRASAKPRTGTASHPR